MKMFIILLFPLMANALYVDKAEFKKSVFKFYQNPKDCKSRCIKAPKNFNPNHYRILKNKLVVDDKKKLKLERAERKKKEFDLAVQKEIQKLEFGKRLYASIKVLNDTAKLSDGQKLQMAQQFSSIKYNLLEGNIKIARSKIYKIKPDGIIVTQEIKDYVLKEINDYLKTSEE